MSQQSIESGLALIFDGIRLLQREFPHRQFTIDGRLVGDLGEIIAAAEFDVVLDEKGQAHHDATTPDGRRVQIKATFQNDLTFRTIPELYLGLKLFQDGRHEVIFNGPGKIIYDRYSYRKGIGADLLRFPVKVLKGLSAQVSDADRVPARLR